MKRMLAATALLLCLLVTSTAHASQTPVQSGDCGWTPELLKGNSIESQRNAAIATDSYVEARIVYVAFPNHATTLPTWADDAATQLHDFITTMSRGTQDLHLSVLRRTDVPGDAWVADNPASYYANPSVGYGALNYEIMNKIAVQQSGVWTGVEMVFMVHYQCTFNCGVPNDENGCSYNCPWGGIATLALSGSVPGFTGTGITQRMYYPMVSEPLNREIQLNFAGHEYGHILGLYHSPGSDYGQPYFANVGRYDLMRSGNYGTNYRSDGLFPYSALQLMKLGWLPSTTITTDTKDLHIPDCRAATAQAIRVNLPNSGPSQFILLETHRGGSLFDAKLAGTGLLVWHVVDPYNNPTSGYFWDIESAVGKFTSGQPDPVAGRDSLELDPWYGGSGNDLFDGVAKTNFSRGTNPNTNAYDPPAYYITTPQSVLTSVGIENMRRDPNSTDMIVDVYVTPKQYVLSPNGGETIERGSPTNITWATRPLGAITNVDVLVSSNGGGNWTTLATAIANSGSYSWTPAVTGSQYRVRVVSHDQAGNTGSDDSDVNFNVSESGHWIALPPFGSARKQPALAFDSARQRVLLFGGTNGTTNFNDLYALDSADQWSAVTTSGTPPSPRRNASLVYDVPRDRMIVFGGYSDPNSMISQLTDLWQLNLSNNTWTQLNPGPPPTFVAYSAYAVRDPIRDRLLVLEGTGIVWTYPLAGGTWSVLAYSGLNGAGAHYFSTAYDSLGDQVLAFSGWVDGPYPNLNNQNGVSAFPLSGPYPNNWQNFVATGTPPARRSLSTMIYEPTRDRGVIFGGEEFLTTPNPHYNDTWELSLFSTPRWWQMAPTGSGPGPRSQIGSTYDPRFDRMVIAGGTNGTTNYAETWALSWDELAPAQVTDFNPSVWCTHIDFTWTVPGDDGTIGQPVAYEMRKSSSLITPANWANAYFAASGPCSPHGTQQDAVILNYGFCSPKYYYAVKVRDDGYNWSALSNVTSKIGTPCPQHGIICDEYAHGPSPDPKNMELSLGGSNPATGPVSVNFGIPSLNRGDVYQVAVFDLAGRRVQVLDHGAATPGRVTLLWDRTDDSGARVSAGVYYVRFQLGARVLTKSVVALR